jgi:hypothetical protein
MTRKTTSLESKIQTAIDKWQPLLHLERWKLTIKWSEIDGGAAEVAPEGMYEAAYIKFNAAELEGKTDEYIERTVVHELVHLLDRDRQEVMAQVENNLSPDTFKLFENVNSQMTESFVDRIATILYELEREAE